MDETLMEIAELMFRGQSEHPRMKDLLDSLTARELKFIEYSVQELQRQIALAQVRKRA